MVETAKGAVGAYRESACCVSSDPAFWAVSLRGGHDVAASSVQTDLRKVGVFLDCDLKVIFPPVPYVN